jgi:hypothetical protein
MAKANAAIFMAVGLGCFSHVSCDPSFGRLMMGGDQHGHSYGGYAGARVSQKSNNGSHNGSRSFGAPTARSRNVNGRPKPPRTL